MIEVVDKQEKEALLVDSPQYKHNCTNCRFLGRKEMANINFDLYLCKAHPVFVARYGSNKEEVLTGMYFPQQLSIESFARAKLLGYIQ